MHTDYMNPVIRQLRDQQVRFAPRDKKLEQVNRAEKLIRRAGSARVLITYEYLCYRITDYRPDSFPNMKLSGEEAASTICGCSSKTFPTRRMCLCEAAGERVLTVEELSRAI